VIIITVKSRGPVSSHIPPPRKISPKCVDDFLSCPADRQTDRQTDRSKNITALVEVKSGFWVLDKELLEACSQKTEVMHYTETVACLENDLIEGTIPGQKRGRPRHGWVKQGPG